MNDGVSRCAKQFRKISNKVGKTILENSMIRKGDLVLAGLSGGKDSLILLEVPAVHSPRNFQCSTDA